MRCDCAGDYRAKLRNFFLYGHQNQIDPQFYRELDVTFESVLSSLASLSQIKRLDLRRVETLHGNVWESLILLPNLEWLSMKIGLTASQACQAVSQMSKRYF